MRISIALASYNGEKHLEEQLQSFLDQTRLPDELVVTDDCSSDNTLSILEEFKAKAPFEVHIYQNEKNLGYSGNFEHALSRCSGDLIFMSDQDDSWFPEKIDTMCRVMNENPKLFIAINDTEISDGENRPLGISKLTQVKSVKGNYDGFVPGCCSVIRKSFEDVYLPIPLEYQSYDGWLHLIGRHLENRKVIPETLQLYRRHGSNTSNIDSNRSKRIGFFSGLIINLKKLFGSDNGAKLKDLYYEIQGLRVLLNRLEKTNVPVDDDAKRKVEQNLSKVLSRYEICKKNRLQRLPSLIPMLVSPKKRGGLSFRSILSDMIKA